MIRYYVYNLEIDKNFTVDNVLFERISNYKRNVRIIKDKHKDQLTFYAIEEASKPSKFFSGNSTTSVNDMMILLSLAQSRNIFYAKAKDTKTRNEWGMALGGKRQPSGHIVITEDEIENYLNTSLNQIREPNWIEYTGLDKAIFWWLESVYANRPLETKFLSAFVALEILANSYCSQKNKSNVLTLDKFKLLKNNLLKTLQKLDDNILPLKKELISNKISSELNRLSIKEKIRILCDAYGWDFIDDELTKDWGNIRNKYMHEGSVIALNKFKEKKPLAERYFQLVYSVQVALLELIGFKNFKQKPLIIERNIREPKITIIRDAGPFKVTT